MRFYTIAILAFLLPATITQAADKTTVDPIVLLQQQVLELQKEVSTLKSTLAKVSMDQSKQQNYVQITDHELVIDSVRNATIIAADKLTLKSGDASIVLTKYGDILIKGLKYDVITPGDIKIKGSKINSN